MTEPLALSGLTTEVSSNKLKTQFLHLSTMAAVSGSVVANTRLKEVHA